jgi:hypothetical protein
MAKKTKDLLVHDVTSLLKKGRRDFEARNKNRCHFKIPLPLIPTDLRPF